MDKLWNEIKRLADSNNGFIRTSDIETAGISRMVLRKYVDAGKLEQIRKGLYTLSDDLADEFALIQVQSTKAIFSLSSPDSACKISQSVMTPEVLSFAVC